MTLKKYLFLMVFSTVLSVGGLILVLIFINPFEAGMMGMALFFAVTTLSLTGILSMIGFLLRYLTKKNEFAYNQVKTTFRQGLLLASLMSGVLFLQARRLLVWWNLILLILLVSCVEYWFLVKNSDADKEGRQ